MTIVNADGERITRSFKESLFNVTHFEKTESLWIQIQAKGSAGFSNVIHIEINFKNNQARDPLKPLNDLRNDLSISLLPILCLLAGSLVVLLSVVAGILECSRRKYSVSNEVTHISFANNLDLNPSKYNKRGQTSHTLACTTEHRVHKNGISADFKFAFLSLIGLSFRVLS